VLLFPANLAPLMTGRMSGAERTSVLSSGIVARWRDGWDILALLLGTFGIVLPFLRFVAFVLGAVRLGWRFKGIGALFRWKIWFDVWAMPDVFLVGCFIGYARVTQNLVDAIDDPMRYVVAARHSQRPQSGF
jgi:paraquat-inducible protein A